MGFEIMSGAQIQSIVRSRSVDPTLLESDLKGLREMAYIAFLSEIGVEELPMTLKAGGGIAVTPEQIDVTTAPEWPLRARTRRIKKALELAAPMGPGMEIGLVKSGDGDVTVNEGGQKATKAPVVFRESGIHKLIEWFRGLPTPQRVKIEDEVNEQIGLSREDVLKYENAYNGRKMKEADAEAAALAKAAGETAAEADTVADVAKAAEKAAPKGEEVESREPASAGRRQ